MAFIPESMFRNSQDFHGVPDFMMRRATSFSGMDRAEEFHPDDDASDDGSQLMLGDKKRRLNPEQVKALEKSFDSGSKLEPERKMQLARALGLQPRQIAIWFQNRRARWKNKQLERDYDVLKRQFEAIKADNDDLKSQNKNLQTQLSNMRSRDYNATAINLNKDNEGSNWSGSENSCDREVNLNAINYHTAAPATTLTHLINGDNPQKNIGNNSQAPVSNDHCFGNVMFGGIEENPEFWLWPEQDHLQ